MDKDIPKTEQIDETEVSTQGGILYLISTPIGNDDDISLRALKTIRGSHLVVCEEGKIGGRFLCKHQITQKMELLNENNEIEKTFELLEKLKKGKRIALVSDCGTPLLADPGLLLVQECIKNEIRVVAVPGASSVMTALVMSSFPINSFFYAGFLSREKSIRINQIVELANNPHTIVLLETPYRLMPLLEAFLKVIPLRRAYIGCNLTMPYETHHYGTFSELYDKFNENRFKGEFVVVFEGNLDATTVLVPESSSVESDYRNENSQFGLRDYDSNYRRPNFRSKTDDRFQRKYEDARERSDYKSKESFPARGRKRFDPDSNDKDKNDNSSRGERRPYKRDGDNSSRGERRPYKRDGDNSSRGERRPYKRDGDNSSRGERRTYKRDGDNTSRGERRPYKRDGDNTSRGERRPYKRDGDNSSRGERRPYKRDGDNTSRGERRPYKGKDK